LNGGLGLVISEEPCFELDSLTPLQRKLLVDLVRRNHPQFWSCFRSHFYGWEDAKINLEVFLQNHSLEFIEELVKAGFDGGDLKIHRRGDDFV
jgi:hypothetical protein